MMDLSDLWGKNKWSWQGQRSRLGSVFGQKGRTMRLFCLFFPTWVVFAEGLAAGAMLTMIAAAMIPEAVHLGNANAVGLSTLVGFLAAISFKLLE